MIVAATMVFQSMISSAAGNLTYSKCTYFQIAPSLLSVFFSCSMICCHQASCIASLANWHGVWWTGRGHREWMSDTCQHSGDMGWLVNQSCENQRQRLNTQQHFHLVRPEVCAPPLVPSPQYESDGATYIWSSWTAKMKSNGNFFCIINQMVFRLSFLDNCINRF